MFSYTKKSQLTQCTNLVADKQNTKYLLLNLYARWQNVPYRLKIARDVKLTKCMHAVWIITSSLRSVYQ